MDGIWEFVVDADSNFDIPSFTDANSDGSLDAADETIWPGFAYDMKSVSPEWYKYGLQQALYEKSVAKDQWGFLLLEVLLLLVSKEKP